jgi:hypothetical protein
MFEIFTNLCMELGMSNSSVNGDPMGIVPFGDSKWRIFPCGDEDGGESSPEEVWR